MTIKENERLAVVETKVEGLVTTVTAMDEKLDLALEYMVTEKAKREGQHSVWNNQRAFILVAVSAIGGVISTLNFLVDKL